MKYAVIIDIPDDANIVDPSTPFEVNVKLDYGESVLYLDGELKLEDQLEINR